MLPSGFQFPASFDGLIPYLRLTSLRSCIAMLSLPIVLPGEAAEWCPSRASANLFWALTDIPKSTKSNDQSQVGEELRLFWCNTASFMKMLQPNKQWVWAPMVGYAAIISCPELKPKKMSCGHHSPEVGQKYKHHGILAANPPILWFQWHPRWDLSTSYMGKIGPGIEPTIWGFALCY